MTYKSIVEELKKIRKGETTASELIEFFELVRQNKKEVIEDIEKSYTLEQLKKEAYIVGGGKKKDYAERLYDRALSSFLVRDEMVSYSPFSGQTYEGQLAIAVAKTTDKDIQNYADKFQKDYARYDKVKNNPETDEEIREHGRKYGVKNLTKQQLQRYEELLAEDELKRQAEEAARKGTVKRVEIGDTSMDIQQTKHTKTGADLWVVRLSDRVEKDVYQQLNTAAKRLGGYYSSYRGGGAIPGFQFKTEDDAKQFVALRDGDVQKQKEDKIESASERLKAAAERKAEAAQEELNKDRNTNTVRRARMANSAEEKAKGQIKWAATLERLAELLKAGELKYLAKVQAVSQLETLDMIWGRARADRFQAQEGPKRSDEFPRDIEKDIDFVQYPYPKYWGSNLKSRILSVQNKPGIKMAAARLLKGIDKLDTSEKMVVVRGGRIDDLRKIAQAQGEKYDAEYVGEPIAHYDRMQRMGITTLPLLKMALREFAKVKSAGDQAISTQEEAEMDLRKQEREFVGRKYDGFFPTPMPLVDELLRLADIQPGDEVLEPSAGIGHIADAIKRAHPDAQLQVVELVAEMAQLLEKKGHNVDQGDFLSYRPEKRFDVVVMNPPFEKDADIEHVMHAWQLLKPGGRLVAIMAGNKDGQGKKKEAFREMVDKYGTIERNPEGAFKSAFRSTGVNTVTVVLDKPSAAPVAKENEQEPTPDEKEPEYTPISAFFILKKNVLTPSGSLKADAVKSTAGSAVWWYQGAISQVSMIANVKIAGEADPKAQWAKETLDKLKAAQAEGWRIVSYRAGAYGTVWVLEKGDYFLTRYGLDNIGDAAYNRPNLPPSEAGFDNFVRRAIPFAAGFVAWLDTMPREQQNNLATVNRRLNASPVQKWARIQPIKDGSERALQYLEENKPGFSFQIVLPWDWEKAVIFLKALAAKLPELEGPKEPYQLWYEVEAQFKGKKPDDDMAKKTEKTDCPKEMNIGDIYIDERRFQNRSKLNEHVVNSIAENYDENQFDPVVVWDDPLDGKTYLLAGHHRLAGVKKAGRKTIKTRCFEGSEAEAIAYAKELSNANRTLETPLERAAIYRRKLDAGESPEAVRKQAEKLEGKNSRYILNLAHLNPDGKVVNALLALADNSDKLTQNNLEKIADWAGEARRQFGVLTGKHENECYDFLLENLSSKRPTISRKDDFLSKISAIVNAMDFDKEKALNLKRIQYKTQGESEYERQMGEIDDRIREVESKKDALKDRLNNPRDPKYVNPQAPDYDEVVRLANAQMDKYDEELKALRKQKLELAQKKGQMVSGGLSQGDLFAQAAAKIEQVVEEVRQQQKKPAAPAQPKPVASAPTPSKPEEKEEPILTGVENLRDQYERAYDPAYRKYISGKLKELSELGAEMNADKVIELGILVRPYVQRLRGAVVDVESTNKRVLAPTLNNLARWAEKPGYYDLVGVDIHQGADPTTLAKQVKRSVLFNLLGLK